MTMRVRGFLAAVAALAWMVAAGSMPARAQDASFELQNNGGTAIREVFVSPSSSGQWGRDVLGAGVIQPGNSQRITPFAKECIFDVKVVWAGGANEERRRQNLCQISRMAFSGGAGGVAGGVAGGSAGGSSTPVGSRGGDPTFDLVNAGSVSIFEVYVSPSSINDWGRDVLGSSVISGGNRHRIRPAASSECVFDIKVVYRGGGAEERRRQNLCEISSLTFRRD
ncbi:MAG: Tat pathway signal protein [Pseudomonadota bacterium]